MKDQMDKEALARAFAYQLRNEIGAAMLAEVVARNKTAGYAACCASHDFCDANMVMMDAGVLLGYWTEDDFDPDAAMTIMGEAWDIAKKSAFAYEAKVDRLMREIAASMAIGDGRTMRQFLSGLRGSDGMSKEELQEWSKAYDAIKEASC